MEITPPLGETSDMQAQLRRRGLRPTSARLHVLQILREHRLLALPSERIFMLLAARDMNVSLGTIYRILSELEHAGMVQREWHVADAVGKSRYLLAPAVHTPQSYDLVCPSCASRHTITDKFFLEVMQQQARAGGFELGVASTAISMLCNRCAAG